MRNCACNTDRLRERLFGLEWRLIDEGPGSGAWNMAVDVALLEAARRGEAPPTLRLYGWQQPTLSLGRHQDPRAGIDHEYRRGRGIDLVRRPTGGRAVLHDQEVTYSIILPAALGRGAGVGEVYGVLSGVLQAGLTALLAELREGAVGQISRPEHRPPSTAEHLKPASCFAAAAGGDELVDGRKLIGSAQARRGGAVLQHGSVLLALRRSDWLGLFGISGIEIALADLGGGAPDEGAVRGALRRGLEQGLAARLAPGMLGVKERAEAERLLAERQVAGCLD
jgi:lipoate-protein ligase A